MSRDLGLPVPPGFVITTATCRTFLARRLARRPRRRASTQMADVEAAVGRRFGDPSDPLLVSVRSGAPISMPGMMDTILNLGLNDATTDGLARPPATRRSRGRAASASRRASDRSSASTTSRPTRGSSCALAIEAVFRSGTATGRGPTARRRGSRTTSGPRSPSRRWSSATGARRPGPASSSPGTPRPARPRCTAT